MAAARPRPTPQLLADLLDASLKAASLPIYGSVGPSGLAAVRGDLHPLVAGKFGADTAVSAIAAALPYGEGPAEPEWAAALPGPRASLARFARADWYGELAARLKAAASATRAALRERGLDAGRARDWRYLSNSGLPEKRFALMAGLGVLGRHGLVMVEGHGSAVVLGLLLLPFETGAVGSGADESARPTAGADESARATAGASGEPLSGSSCWECRACRDACPTGALVEEGGRVRFERESCLQQWTAREGALPAKIEAALGGRLYGCDACQEACPRFRPDPSAVSGRGRLGPGLPAAWLVEAPDRELRERLRGTALGLGWMPLAAFRRNAALVLGRRAPERPSD